jgi:phosphatidylethanolamine-binding protein (PEBP) family uncharacterized protein
MHPPAWHHWAAYDLPPTVMELAVGAAQNKNIKQAANIAP